MSTENLKRSGSLESPQTLAKVPKIENDQVNNEENIVDNNNEKVQSPEINDVLMKKIDNIVKQVETYKFSNQEAIGNLNSKLDKALNILKENSADTCPKFRIFNPKVANVMICCWESFFNVEDLMTNYGIVGKNVTSKILSYLDFKSMVAARMVSKTWYAFIEKERGLWINLMKKCFQDSQLKNSHLSKSTPLSLQEWGRFGNKIIEKNGKVADIVTFISAFRENNLNNRTWSENYEYERSWSLQSTSYYRSSTETTIHFKQQKDANLWQTLNFVKILAKYDILDASMGFGLVLTHPIKRSQ